MPAKHASIPLFKRNALECGNIRCNQRRPENEGEGAWETEAVVLRSAPTSLLDVATLCLPLNICLPSGPSITFVDISVMDGFCHQTTPSALRVSVNTLTSEMMLCNRLHYLDLLYLRNSLSENEIHDTCNYYFALSYFTNSSFRGEESLLRPE